MSFWQEKRILVGICGGIAAYKTCSLISSLAQQGAFLRVVMTSSAESFVAPLTFSTLARASVFRDSDFWQPSLGRPLHIELGEWGEALVIAPLSAHTLAKLTCGLADNLLLNIVLASACPILLSPAMNTQMWLAQSVQRNWKQIQEDRRFWPLLPTEGRLACDTVGAGRMVEPEGIEAALLAMLWTKGQKDWQGKKVLVTGGGTREPIDQVRFIGNPSSGRMGLALAAAAAFRGADVTFIHAPLDPGLNLAMLQMICGIKTVSIISAADLEQALHRYFLETDYLFMAAAVGDVRPQKVAATKLPKENIPLRLELETVPDLLKRMRNVKKPHQKMVGFAAQVEDPLPLAQIKLSEKGLDAIVANPIDRPDSGFVSFFNEAILLSHTGKTQSVPRCSKQILAHHILDFAHTL
jgi:phosphopantothenoylcysteine decarboxylase/phosphopantothenate--cysteine ligase